MDLLFFLLASKSTTQQQHVTATTAAVTPTTMPSEALLNPLDPLDPLNGSVHTRSDVGVAGTASPAAHTDRGVHVTLLPDDVCDMYCASGHPSANTLACELAVAPRYVATSTSWMGYEALREKSHRATRRDALVGCRPTEQLDTFA